MGAIILLFVLGITLLLAGFRSLLKARKIKQWNQIEALLVSRGIKVTDQLGGSRSSQHEVDIEYEYTIGGNTYRSKNYAPVHIIESESAIEKKIAQFPEKSLVFVNPENPQEAYYTISPPILAYILLGSGVLCLFVLLFAAFFPLT